MLRRRSLLAATAALVPLAAGRAFAEPAPAPTPPPLVVVVAKDSPLVALSMTDLRALFLGEARNDPRGTKLVPVNLPPGTADRTAFDRLALGMTPDEIGRYWVDRKIRGEGRPPRTFDSPALIQRLVAKFPGAIAYVRALPASLDPAVRALRIDGKLPGDAGYALAGDK